MVHRSPVRFGLPGGPFVLSTQHHLALALALILQEMKMKQTVMVMQMRVKASINWHWEVRRRFGRCLSGDFYNLYTEDWAAQCSPVELRLVGFVVC